MKMRSSLLASLTTTALTALAAALLSAAPAARTPPALTSGDLRWLGRVTFGIDSASVAEYRRVGREKFLDEQLRASGADACANRRRRGSSPSRAHCSR